MAFSSVSDSPKLIGKRDAFHNHFTFEKYHIERNESRKPWIGIYRGHRFVLIKESYGIFTKLHYLLQRLFRLIKTDQNEIDRLHQISEERYNNLPLIKELHHAREALRKLPDQVKETFEQELHNARETLAIVQAELNQAKKTIATFGDQVHDIAKRKIEEAGEKALILELKLKGAEKRAEEKLSKVREEARLKLEEFEQKSTQKLEKLRTKLASKEEQFKEAYATLESKLAEKQAEFEQQLKDTETKIRTEFQSSIDKIQAKLKAKKEEIETLSEKLHKTKGKRDKEKSETAEPDQTAEEHATTLNKKTSKIHKIFHPKEQLKLENEELKKQVAELQKNNEALSQQWEEVENEENLLNKIKTFSRALLDQNNPEFVNKLLQSLTKTHRDQLENYWKKKISEKKHQHRKSLEVVQTDNTDEKAPPKEHRHSHRRSREITAPIALPEEPQATEQPEVTEQPVAVEPE